MSPLISYTSKFQELELESKVILVAIIGITAIALYLGGTTYQELSLEKTPEFSMDVNAIYEGETIPLIVSCKTLYTDQFIAGTTPISCSYTSKKNMSSTDLPLDNLLTVKLMRLKTGIVPLQNNTKLVSSVPVQFNDQKGGMSRAVTKKPKSAGRYHVTIKATNMSKDDGFHLETWTPQTVTYYTRSQLTQSKYRSAVLLLNLLIWASLVLQARGVILRIERG